MSDCAGACCSSLCLGGAKAGLAAALTLEALACVALGAWIGRRAKATRLANAFAAGVFLASALVHILPHAAAALSGAHDDAHDDHGTASADADLAAESADDDHAGHDHGDEHDDHAADDASAAAALADADADDHAAHSEPFPVANVIALGTLLALLLIETVLLARFSHGSHGHGAACAADDEHVAAAAPAKAQEEERRDGPGCGHTCAGAHLGAALTHDDAAHDAALPPKRGHASEYGSTASASSASLDAAAAAAAAAPPGDVEAGAGASSSDAPKAGAFLSPAFFAASLLVLAVSVHSFLESVSFGLTPTFSSAITVFVAIAAHRWIVATAVLSRLAVAPGLRTLQRVVLYAAFVLVLPLGVALGAALSNLPSKVEGAFVAASGGAFLYLGMEGIFAEMVHHSKWRVLKFLSLCVGAGCIVTVDVVLRALDIGH